MVSEDKKLWRVDMSSCRWDDDITNVVNTEIVVYGSVAEVKNYLCSLVRDDKEENEDTFEEGTLNEDEIRSSLYEDFLHAYSSMRDCSKSYAATPLSAVAIDLEKLFRGVNCNVNVVCSCADMLKGGA